VPPRCAYFSFHLYATQAEVTAEFSAAFQKGYWATVQSCLAKGADIDVGIEEKVRVHVWPVI
jgi:hypothetical protein